VRTGADNHAGHCFGVDSNPASMLCRPNPLAPSGVVGRSIGRREADSAKRCVSS
jgi:hypothetical protein